MYFLVVPPDTGDTEDGNGTKSAAAVKGVRGGRGRAAGGSAGNGRRRQHQSTTEADTRYNSPIPLFKKAGFSRHTKSLGWVFFAKTASEMIPLGYISFYLVHIAQDF